MKQRETEEFFKFFVYLKGVHAAFEVLTGILVYFITPTIIQNFIRISTLDELAEDPRDFIGNYLLHTAQSFTIAEQSFISLYLVGYGILNLLLVIGLLKDRLWVYPIAITAFIGAVVYQIYRFTHTHSLPLLVFTLLDIVVIWFVYREYKILKRKATR